MFKSGRKADGLPLVHCSLSLTQKFEVGGNSYDGGWCARDGNWLFLVCLFEANTNRIEPRALYMQGKRFTTELHAQPQELFSVISHISQSRCGCTV